MAFPPISRTISRLAVRSPALLRLTLGVLLLGLGSASLHASEVGELRAGAAKVDITPADLSGIFPWGGAFVRVRDRIYARALVLENGGEAVAVVALDLLEIGDMLPVRQRIEKEVGIPLDHIFITATHTHSAPRLGLASPGALAQSGNAASLAYSQEVYAKMIAALKQAKDKMQAARVGTATSRLDLNVNREVYGEKGWSLGENPEGPSDKTVSVTKFESLNGKPIGVLINYAIHPTVSFGSRQISGDIAGATEAYVEKQLGDETVALWTPGALGDQAPRISFGEPKKATEAHWASVFEAVDAQGVIIAAEVVRSAARIGHMNSSVRLLAKERVQSCPTKKGSDIQSSMKQVDAAAVDLRLGLLMVDETTFLGVSGEVVSNIQTRLKKASPLTNTVLMSMTNDRIGYIADDAAYDRPVHSVNGSPAARGCAENAIVDGFLEMIKGR